MYTYGLIRGGWQETEIGGRSHCSTWNGMTNSTFHFMRYNEPPISASDFGLRLGEWMTSSRCQIVTSERESVELCFTHLHEGPIVVHLLAGLEEVAAVCPHGRMLLCHYGRTYGQTDGWTDTERQPKGPEVSLNM